MERGDRALDRLELGLEGRAFLVGGRLSIADIALCPLHATCRTRAASILHRGPQ